MNDAILEKVRKLRALATSSNVHEAAAAAAAAERLIQEHDLSEAELAVEQEEPVATRDRFFNGPAPIWRQYLLSVLAHQYSCATVWVVYPSSRRRVYQVFGRRADLETLAYQDAFFTLEIERLVAREGRGRGQRWRRSFRLGAVTAIAQALDEARSQARAQATSAALAVVDRRAEAADRAVDRAHPGLGPAKKPRLQEVDGAAYRDGIRAGQGIRQRTELGAGGERLLAAPTEAR